MTEPISDQVETWPILEQRPMHEPDWVISFRADYVHPPGDPDHVLRRYVLDAPGAVMVLALDEQDRVVVLRQFRHPVGKRLVELPAGMLDKPGEDPRAAAERELQEETGLAADAWEPLISIYPSPGISAEKHHIFLATGLREVGRGGFELEAEEADMSVDRVPFDDLVAAIESGAVEDAPLVAGVLALAVKRGPRHE